MSFFTPKRIFALAISFVFFLIGARFTVSAVSDYREWLSFQDAIETDAEILHYEHEQVKIKRSTVQRTIFSYTYNIDGQQYSETTPFIGPYVSWRTAGKETDRLIAAADRGEVVTCYVNPHSPGDSFLSLNVVDESNVVGSRVFAIGFTFFGVALFVSCILNRDEFK